MFLTDNPRADNVLNLQEYTADMPPDLIQKMNDIHHNVPLLDSIEDCLDVYSQLTV